MSKLRVCRICGLDETVGGEWCDKYNPIYFREKVYYAKDSSLEGHGICLKMAHNARHKKNTILSKVNDRTYVWVNKEE
jgi:hypothetical protein